MLVKLSAKGLRRLSDGSSESFIARVCEEPERAVAERGCEVFLAGGGGAATRDAAGLPEGFRGYLLRERAEVGDARDAYLLGAEHRYLRAGDVVRVEPTRGVLTALWRAESRSNSFLLTERCDNFCVMCSQPPREGDDSWLVDELEQVIPLVGADAREIGITGGEPTLLGERFVRVLRLLRESLPQTAVHVLSNGRRFADSGFAGEVAGVGHPDLMIGIPVYSDLAEVHDYVVQARGAFDETVRGVLNLKRKRVRVELRFVVHRETVGRMAEFARWVARNLTFVDHVALMGLEPMGFARANFERLWVDPVDYAGELEAAVRVLDRAGMAVSIYNHQLCVIERGLWRFARKSISDWKNAYAEECEGCGVREECGGFFASAGDGRRSRGIGAVRQRGGS